MADVKGLRFSGAAAFLLWAFVHLYYLVGWGNRIGTITRWKQYVVVPVLYWLISCAHGLQPDLHQRHHGRPGGARHPRQARAEDP